MNRILHTVTALAAGCLLWTSIATADDFRPIPNSVKYRDSGIPNAKGNAGNATIEVRALLNSDGTVDVEATTGSFDPAVSGSGTIKNVHIEVDGQVYDFSGDGGTFSATGLTGLAPGAVITVHVNVKDLDGRNENIRVQTTVKRRPDLAFTAVRATQHGVVGMPISFVATAQELNGQTGARANCVLYHGSVEIDRADGIWVDAGGTVDCVFSPSFAEPGIKQMTARLERVSPGDWDLSNNEVGAESTIHALDEEFPEWRASALDEAFSYYFRSYNANREIISTTTGVSTALNLEGVTQEPLDINTMRLSFTAQTDGQSFANVQDVAFSGWTYDIGFQCARVFEGAFRATACSFATDRDHEFGRRTTSFSVNVQNRDVTYYSKYWQVYYDASGQPHYYTDESTFHEQSGNGQRLGSNVSMNLSVTDGTRTWWATPSFALRTTEIHDGYTDCWFGTCEEFRRDLVQKYGSAQQD